MPELGMRKETPWEVSFSFHNYPLQYWVSRFPDRLKIGHGGGILSPLPMTSLPKPAQGMISASSLCLTSSKHAADVHGGTYFQLVIYDMAPPNSIPPSPSITNGHSIPSILFWTHCAWSLSHLPSFLFFSF